MRTLLLIAALAQAPSLIYGPPPQVHTFAQTATVTVANSTTFVNIPGLSYNVNASTPYLLGCTFNAIEATPASGGFKILVAVPSGTSENNPNTAFIYPYTANSNWVAFFGIPASSIDSASTGFPTSALNQYYVTIQQFFTTGSTAGAVTVQFAQSSSSATLTRIFGARNGVCQIAQVIS